MQEAAADKYVAIQEFLQHLLQQRSTVASPALSGDSDGRDNLLVPPTQIIPEKPKAFPLLQHQ